MLMIGSDIVINNEVIISIKELFLKIFYKIEKILKDKELIFLIL